ncbi:MAG: hypothetical protein PHT07_15915 [Paludibacter sp.]|nr:hypothetical protein [Paludibacter sp.]
MIDNGKAKITDSMDELKIVIPSKKNWFVILFTMVWMGGWYMGFKSAMDGFGENAFITFWMIGWTIGGCSAIFVLLWSLFGQEIIRIDFQDLFLEKSIFGIGIKRRLAITELNNIRYEAVERNGFSGNNDMSIILHGAGPIKMDYGLKTYTVGFSVDEAEAKYIIELIRKKTKK